ncbi:uncharacterized protein K441DRAFT_675933 [Cenococcum geophilum 1.58]|uniref:uncharacterized protein n=1 Tax=Cenococcum geophilum 1.58 TaxID=794803 RepID=UPI00358F2C99|nr:hypothetical protein K441DRAFT_675933 [Cenococcum geophilum 1.58]
MDDPEEGEWEYEYDENETENFYITLDLSNAAPASKPRKADVSSLTQTIADTARQTRHSTGDLHSGRDNSASTPTHSNPDLAKSNGMNAIQILDLHTHNPLISYQGQLLSCRWASTIGSDLLFADAPQDRESYPEPLRALPSFDLLGISSTKLIATITQLRPRYSSPSTQEQKAAPEPTQANTIGDDPLETDIVNIPSSHDALKAQNNQLNFLSRLNAAKEKRGEKDRAPAAGYKKTIVLDETDGTNIQSGEDSAAGNQQDTLVDYEIPAWPQARQDDGNENGGTRYSTDTGVSTSHHNDASTAPSSLVNQMVEVGEPPNGRVQPIHDEILPAVQSRSAEDDVVMSESNDQPAT